jgi:hypothetical protein
MNYPPMQAMMPSFPGMFPGVPFPHIELYNQTHRQPCMTGTAGEYEALLKHRDDCISSLKMDVHALTTRLEQCETALGQARIHADHEKQMSQVVMQERLHEQTECQRYVRHIESILYAYQLRYGTTIPNGADPADSSAAEHQELRGEEDGEVFHRANVPFPQYQFQRPPVPTGYPPHGMQQ